MAKEQHAAGKKYERFAPISHRRMDFSRGFTQSNIFFHGDSAEDTLSKKKIDATALRTNFYQNRITGMEDSTDRDSVKSSNIHGSPHKTFQNSINLFDETIFDEIPSSVEFQLPFRRKIIQKHHNKNFHASLSPFPCPVSSSPLSSTYQQEFDGEQQCEHCERLGEISENGLYECSQCKEKRCQRPLSKVVHNTREAENQKHREALVSAIANRHNTWREEFPVLAQAAVIDDSAKTSLECNKFFGRKKSLFIASRYKQ